MQDLSFQVYLDKVAEMLKVAQDIGIDPAEVIDHLSSGRAEGTQPT